MKVTALFLALLVPTAAGAGTLDKVNAGLVLGDLALTETVLARGGQELNPMVRDRGARLVWGAARVVVAVGVPRWLETKDRRGWARGIRVGCAVIGGAVVAHNLAQLTRGR